MLFWTVVFIIGNLYWIFLAPTKLFDNFDAKVFDGLDKEQIKEKLLETGLIKMGYIAILLLVWNIAEFIYKICALRVDPLIYPTVVVLLYEILMFLFVCKRKEKYKHKTVSRIFRLFNGLIFIVYFSYMFYVLVF